MGDNDDGEGYGEDMEVRLIKNKIRAGNQLAFSFIELVCIYFMLNLG